MPDLAPVLTGVDFSNMRMNVDRATTTGYMAQAIRRGHPQVWRCAPKPDRVCLVGGGPSLDDTFDELRQLVFEGARLVTLNGAYHYCLARNLRPGAQIVLDARPSNVKFLQPAVPRCIYYLSSQCHPDLFDAVEGRAVGIFHALDGDGDEEARAVLDAYYRGRWTNVAGGTTVGSRGLGVLSLLGYLRFDFFGIDCCWLGDRHHAYDQPENQERAYTVTVAVSDRPADVSTFRASAWHLKQLEDFLMYFRHGGQRFLVNVHGDGLLAHALRASAAIQVEQENAHGSTGVESL